MFNTELAHPKNIKDVNNINTHLLLIWNNLSSLFFIPFWSILYYIWLYSPFPLLTTHRFFDLLCSRKLCLHQRNLNCAMKWSWKADRGPSVQFLGRALTGTLGRKCYQHYSFMPGGELTEWKGPRGPRKDCREVLAGSQFQVLINSHQSRQASCIPELSNLCKRKVLRKKCHLSLLVTPGNAGELFGVTPILITIWHA
jgi:hypothetical protein